MKRILLFTFVLSALLLAACSGFTAPADSGEVVGEEIAVAGGSYTRVSVPELQSMLAEKDFVFINVHVPFEGDIPGTDLSIPFDQIENSLSQLPADKNAKIVVYCRSGSMSSVAATKLVSLGYTNVWDLDGGFNAWKAAGQPME